MSGRDDPLAESDVSDDDPGRLAQLQEWVGAKSQRISSAIDSSQTVGRATHARAMTVLASGGAKKLYAALGVMIVSIVAFWFVVNSRGLLDAIVYSFLFAFCATVLPIGINLMGGATPNGVGKLHLLLGAVAFNHHYLVQRDQGWEWCPGERGRVYIDDEWHDVSGEENYSILGWRPFGILRYKDNDTWAEKRVDTAGLEAQGSFTRERDPTTDGGTPVVERGGFTEVERPAISGVDGTWVLDLKRLFTNGIRKMGDIELIETAEEIIERRQVDDGKMSNAGPLVETVSGLFLGILCGYGYIFLS